MFQLGQKILAKWSDSGKRDLESQNTPLYFGTIQSINDDETYDVLFHNRTLQENTREKYITTKEQIAAEFMKQFVAKTRHEIKRGSEIYWKKTENGNFKKLGQYVATTVPWEGIEKGKEYERTFLHFTDVNEPIESCHHTDVFYVKST